MLYYTTVYIYKRFKKKTVYIYKYANETNAIYQSYNCHRGSRYTYVQNK